MAGVFCGFVSWETLALHHGNHPFTLSCAVNAWGGLTDGILHADSLHLPQGICNRLREGCQALHGGRTRLVVNPDRQQGHAGAHVLESQVEALFGQGHHCSRLGVDLRHPASCDLIGGDGGDLAELPLAEAGSHVGVSLRDEEVERFFAGDRSAAEGVAVPDDELELHRDAAALRASLNESCPYPVVLVSRVYITNAVGV